MFSISNMATIRIFAVTSDEFDVSGNYLVNMMYINLTLIRAKTNSQILLFLLQTVKHYKISDVMSYCQNLLLMKCLLKSH